MRKLLLHLDADRLPSAFDRVVAYDSGADEVLSYGGVGGADVEGLVHGAIFTRGPKELKNTAIFIGGSRVVEAESLLEAVKKAFFGPFRVSVMVDPNGSNTTAAAAVLKLSRVPGGLKGRRAAVLAGTGPVGARAAGLLLRQGAEVRITSRDETRGGAVAAAIGQRFHGTVGHVVVQESADLGPVLGWAEVLLAAGPAGVQLVPRPAWSGLQGLKAAGDVNAVPPVGIEGVEGPDDGTEREGVAVFGAFAIGGLKMKVHRASVARLFERNDLTLDAEEIYDLAAAL
jgi:hypothetical protein